MKSGYWTREFIGGLFHLITPYWNSEEKKSARLYLAGIITLTIAAVYMTPVSYTHLTLPTSDLV